MHEQEAVYRAAIESCADGFWMVDRQGRLLAVNEAYSRLSGYSREELLAMRIQDLEARETPDETTAHIERLFNMGNDLFDTLHRRKDGTVWQAEIDTSVPSAGGGVLFAFIRDINRRKRSEALLLTRQRFARLAELGQSDELMQGALDEAELYTGSSIGFFHAVNEDQERLTLLAWSSNTLKGMCQANGKWLHYPISQAGVWVDCFHQKQPVIHNDYASLTHRKGLPEGHAPVARELVVPIIRNEKVVAIFGVGNKATDYTRDDVEVVETIASLAIDLVERQRLEDILHRSREELRLIADSVPALLAYIDRDFRFRRVNKKYEQIFGLPVESIPGKHVREVLGETVWPVVCPYMERALAGEQITYEADLRLRDSEPRWMRISYTPGRDANGDVSGFVSHALDITSQKLLEEKSLHTAQLSAVGELSAGVAHEINNPLTGVINCAQILLDREAVAEENRKFLEKIVTEGNRIARIIRGLLFFARPGNAARERVALQKLVQDVLDLVGTKLEKEGISVEVSAPERPVDVIVNPQQIEQVLHHLLDNARYALKERWQLDRRPLHLRIDIAQGETEGLPVARVTVFDNGGGIPAALLGRLGKMFVTTKPAGVGSGLGLSIGRRLVEEHAGRLSIGSTEGEFTEVAIELPLAEKLSVRD